MNSVCLLLILQPRKDMEIQIVRFLLLSYVPFFLYLPLCIDCTTRYSLYDFKLAVTSMLTLLDDWLKLAREPNPTERIRTRAKDIYRHARTTTVKSHWHKTVVRLRQTSAIRL